MAGEAGVVVVIAPHPDDDVIGCGGSIAKRVSEGSDVHLIVVIERERSFHDARMRDEDFDRETADAAVALGLASVTQLRFPSRGAIDAPRLITELATTFRALRPTVIYLPSTGEGDPEHALVGELAGRAIWMASEPFFPQLGPVVAPSPRLVLGYEVWTPMAKYQYVEDITSTLDIKLAAMRKYASQLRIRPYDRAIEGLAAYRGIMTGVGSYAEVFEVVELRTAFKSEGGHNEARSIAESETATAAMARGSVRGQDLTQR
jgi:N-acetylglucosamine malate deacetylase 1